MPAAGAGRERRCQRHGQAVTGDGSTSPAAASKPRLLALSFHGSCGGTHPRPLPRPSRWCRGSAGSARPGRQSRQDGVARGSLGTSAARKRSHTENNDTEKEAASRWCRGSASAPHSPALPAVHAPDDRAALAARATWSARTSVRCLTTAFWSSLPASEPPARSSEHEVSDPRG
jgi:hypothetical protein